MNDCHRRGEWHTHFLLVAAGRRREEGWEVGRPQQELQQQHEQLLRRDSPVCVLAGALLVGCAAGSDSILRRRR